MPGTSSRASNIIEHNITNEYILDKAKEYDMYRLLWKFASKQEEKLKEYIKDRIYEVSGGEVGFKQDVGRLFSFSNSQSSRLDLSKSRELCHELGHDPNMFQKQIRKNAVEPTYSDGRLTYIRYSQLSNQISSQDEFLKNLMDEVKGITKRTEQVIQEDEQQDEQEIQNRESVAKISDEVYNTFETVWALRTKLEDLQEDKKDVIKNLLKTGKETVEIEEYEEAELDYFSNSYVEKEGGFNPQSDQFILNMGNIVFSSREYTQFDEGKYSRFLENILNNPEHDDFDKIVNKLQKKAEERAKNKSLSHLLSSKMKDELLSDKNLMKTLTMKGKRGETGEDIYEYLRENSSENIKNELERHVQESIDNLNHYNEEELNEYIFNSFMSKENKDILGRSVVTKINKEMKENGYESAIQRICQFVEQSENETLKRNFENVVENSPKGVIAQKRKQELDTIVKNEIVSAKFTPSKKKEDRAYINELMDEASERISSFINFSLNQSKIDSLDYLNGEMENAHKENNEFDMFKYIYKNEDNVNESKKTKKPINLSLNM